MGASIKSYRDLQAWQEGMNLAEACHRITQTFPQEELDGIAGEIRRTSTAIPVKIAAGYSRGDRGEFIQFLQVAKGSLNALETHLLIAMRVRLTSGDNCSPILDQCEWVGQLLGGLIHSLEKE